MAALALTAALTMAPQPQYAPQIEAPCAPGLIHTWGVLCVTPAEFKALWHPVTPAIPVELTGEPLVRQLVARYFPSWAVEAAVRVVGCETGYTWNPKAWNSRSGASGLFQHIPRYWAARSAAAGWPGADIFDPEANVAVAAWLWSQTSTWRHWSCKP